MRNIYKSFIKHVIYLHTPISRPIVWCLQIQDIEEQLHEKTDAYSQLLITKEQLEKDLQCAEVTSHDLRDMIRTLEIDLEARTKGENDAKKVYYWL